VRVTRPCRQCHSEVSCQRFLASLAMLVEAAQRVSKRPLPEVVVDCTFYAPKSRRDMGIERGPALLDSSQSDRERRAS